MTAERVIHILVFVLLVTGLWVISAWASYNYLNDPMLQIASILISCGVILLILYVIFKKLGWHWWS